MFRSSLSRANRLVEAQTLLPPKLTELGHQPFAAIEQESLAQLLREPTWPRDTLNIYALEGYLTALLVWPVALQPGAWLPPIWNEGSWRVRPPIDTAPRFGEFLELVLGYMRTIDQGLLQSPAAFEPCLRLKFGYDFPDMTARARCWAQGFGRGLRQSAQARLAPTQDARDAVHTIAAYTTGPSGSSKGGTRQADTVLTKAVLALASTRASRGPLGALPKHATAAKPVDSQAQLQHTVDPFESRQSG